jgi:hydroxymethylpyrimidine/phosphomethylpyrimidine kinase
MFKKTLTIAGFDGSGGAGIQADLKTFSSLGCYGMTVLTAIPIQNTLGVKFIYEISTECIEDQLRAILEDITPDAVKIGMLHRAEIICTIAGVLKEYAPMPIVLDPVMVAKSGHQLLANDAIAAMIEEFFPFTTILTPNLAEAGLLLQREINTKEQMETAAVQLQSMGPQAVVVKGGHLLQGDCEDCLCTYDQLPEIHWFSSPKIHTKNTHGTGCTFSAAIAAFLSKKFTIAEAVNRAKKYIFRCIETGSQFEIGHGNGPVNHQTFYDYCSEENTQ